MSRIAIVGAGAIGGWVAARLALAGHDVSVLTRTGCAAAYADGITLVEGEKSNVAPIRASDDARMLGAQDILVFATKAFALADAADAAQPLLSARTVIVPMINGVPWWFSDQPLASVDPGGRIAATIPAAQVVGNVVHASLRREAAAEIHVQKVDHLIFGEPGGGDSARVAALVELFGQAGIPSRADPEIRRAIWYKAWGNMTMNPMSALTLATADRLLAGARAMKLAAMEEARTIGDAIGCPITESGGARLAVAEKLGPFKTSMLQDVEAGRPIELETLLGAPLELARRHGIPAPTLEHLYSLTRLMAESRGLLP
jgi:2-dehydropantoate 2-reductase